MQIVRKSDDDVRLEEIVRQLSRTDAWETRLLPAPEERRIRRGLQRARRRGLRR